MLAEDLYTDTQGRLKQALASLVPREDLIFDPCALELFRQDVFFKGRLPLAILRPSTDTQLAAAIAAATRAGIPLAARGSGLSYSSAYVSPDTHMLIIDVRRLNAVERIDTEALRVTVQAGCTWAGLYEALAPLGLRTPFWGPASGLHATIGGTLSQDGVLLGSGLFGAASVNTLGLAVIAADGSQLTLTREEQPSTLAAFLGDSGTLGIKTKVTLPLIPAQGALDFAALAFRTLPDAAAAMKEIGKKGLAAECFLYDQTFRDRLRGKPAKDGPYTIEPAPGHRHHADACLEIHAAIEGKDAEDCERLKAGLVASAVRLGGRSIGAGVLGAFRSAPFPAPTLMIGPQGRRWLPTNFIVPHDRFMALFGAINASMGRHRASIKQHGITWSWSALCIGRDHILVEPSLYWKDELGALSRHYLDAAMLEGLPAYPPAPETRAAVQTLRAALIEAGRQENARHIQLGRLYPAASSYTPKDLAEFRTLKQKLDPDGLINPGAATA